MYPSAAPVLHLKSASVTNLNISTSEEDELYTDGRQEEAQPTLTHHHHHPNGAKSSLILSPFSPAKAFPSTGIHLAFLPTDRRGLSALVSPHLLYNSLGKDSCVNIISHLPPEISVKVLLYLDPQDLCSTALVSSRWYKLTHFSTLYKKRECYLQQKREEYQKSKENYPPRSPPHSSLQSRNMISPPTPLRSIQLPQYHSQPASPTPLDSPSRSHTTSPTFLVDDVSRLSLDDQDITLRQSLFSEHTTTLFALEGARALQSALYSFRHAIKEVAGRKMNKNRLRRL